MHLMVHVEMQMQGLHTYWEIIFSRTHQAVVLILIHEWSMQKGVFLSIETSIFSLFHPFNLVVSLLHFHSPASLQDRSQKCTGQRHAVTRCISPKKNNHATVSLPNLDSHGASTFKKHFSGAPSQAQLVSMANGNLISSKRGQQA